MLFQQPEEKLRKPTKSPVDHQRLSDNNRDTFSEPARVSNQRLVPQNDTNASYSFGKNGEEPKSRKQKEEEPICVLKVELDQGAYTQLIKVYEG